jgi:glycerol-3-phosphate dehydrogenase (NAD(P)+)
MTSAAKPGAIAILGAGSWGTALAVQLARSGQPVTIWGRNAWLGTQTSSSR